MGEFTICNYCSFQRIKREASKKKQLIHKKRDPLGSFAGGVRIHVTEVGEKPSEKNFVAWFAELPTQCQC